MDKKLLDKIEKKYFSNDNDDNIPMIPFPIIQRFFMLCKEYFSFPKIDRGVL